MSPGSLLRYLDIKVHHLIREQDWEGITVVGDYDRSAHVSTTEKSGKLFNWQRPTATIQDRTLVLRCFPGSDYVYHYALIVSTYLAMVGRFSGQVRYVLPGEPCCHQPLSELAGDLSPFSAVVTGWGLPEIASSHWVRRNGHWLQDATLGGKRVLYVGFLHSIWGDVAGRVVERFAKLGARRVVYLGKVGTLDPELEPNASLATGRTSRVGDTDVEWDDFFGSSLRSAPDVTHGRHVSSPSILREDQVWLRHHAGAAFVDPEIGPMGRAAAAAGIPFGYLHLVSNNLARICPADLSNERKADTVAKRRLLVTRIGELLARRMTEIEQ